jgi:non-homologous end joining protein Ku
MSSQFEDAFRDLVKDVLHDVDEVEADNVRGLADFVREAIGDESFDVEKIDGLGDYISEQVRDSIKDSVPDAVNEEVDDIIDEKILTALKHHDDIRKVVKTLVRETLKDILSGLIADVDATKG